METIVLECGSSRDRENLIAQAHTDQCACAQRIMNSLKVPLHSNITMWQLRFTCRNELLRVFCEAVTLCSVLTTPSVL
jgi:hypothetical protein